jgi:hypothetical protein
MDKDQVLEILKQCVKIEVDKEKLLELLVVPGIEGIVKGSKNPIDDKVWEFIKPFVLEKLKAL